MTIMSVAAFKKYRAYRIEPDYFEAQQLKTVGLFLVGGVIILASLVRLIFHSCLKRDMDG